MPTINRNIKSVDYIITAQHYGGAKAYIEKGINDIRRGRGIVINVNWEPIEHSVDARIWQGQWIADCECGGASFVDPNEPIFFCLSCANRADNGRVRKVNFPIDREVIEGLILERPVDDLAGLNDKERAGLAKPLVVHEELGGLSRNWNPNETIGDLRKQNEAIEKWRTLLDSQP